METKKGHSDLKIEVEELKAELLEARETLHAIRTGQVDAIVIENEKGHQLYKLQSADHTYRVFIEKMKEGAVTLDADEIILYANSQFASMVGHPLKRIIGKPFREFIPQEFLSIFEELMKAGWTSDSRGELPLRSARGTTIPLLFSFTSLDMDDVKALSIILTDLTQQKKVEAELKDKNRQLEEARRVAARMNAELEDLIRERTRDLFLSREHFKFLADHIPVIVWTTRSDGQVDYFNKQYYSYTGLTKEESGSLDRRAVIHPDDVENAVSAWNKAINSGNAFQWEYRIRRKEDGAYRWHLSKGEPLKDEKGRVLAWFGTSTDIEDQKRQMERKDEFIGVASHELKTPLTSLKGYLQLIALQEGLTPQMGQYLERVNASVNKLQHLINDLLDVSKMQAGKLEFTKEKIDLSVMLANCIESSAHMFVDRPFKRSFGNNIWVYANEERLEQVIMNLVNNAVKYSMKESEITIAAEIKNDVVTVSVSDKGIGLSEHDKEKIFERFYRVKDNKFIASGLGMGLYISSEIVKEHGGQLSVDSKLNEGSTFYFSLPIIAP